MLAFLVCCGYSFVKDSCLVEGHMFKFQVFIWGLTFKFQVHVLVQCFVDVSSSCKFCLFCSFDASTYWEVLAYWV
jgi:hypothetical protein